MLWLIFPSSTAPGSGTWVHPQSFPTEFRTGPQHGNVGVFFTEVLWTWSLSEAHFLRSLLPAEKDSKGRTIIWSRLSWVSVKSMMQHTQTLSAVCFAWKDVDRRRIGVQNFSPATSSHHQLIFTHGSQSAVRTEVSQPKVTGDKQLYPEAHPPVLRKVFNRSAVDCLETGGTRVAWKVGRKEISFVWLLLMIAFHLEAPYRLSNHCSSAKITPPHHLQMLPYASSREDGKVIMGGLPEYHLKQHCIWTRCGQRRSTQQWDNMRVWSTLPPILWSTKS